MKATNTASESETQHPPLAFDANGNRVQIPPDTCAWRICRHTDGRPKIVKGPDKEPARFALDTTATELAEACGADTYRVYALDEVGKVLDYVNTVEAGRELRNTAEPELALVPASRSAMASDLRYALETITVIARTNAEAMRAVAESQAEWIKSISSARGFFRNAAPLALPAPIEPKNDNDDEDDDDEDDDDDGDVASGGNDWVSMLQPIVGIVAEKVVAAVMGGFSNKDGANGKPPFDLLDSLNWTRVAKKREEALRAQEATVAAPTTAVAPPESAPNPKEFEQALIGKAMAISAKLAPTERDRLFKLAPRFSKHMGDPDIVEVLGALVPMSVEDAAEWVRAHLDQLEKMFAS